MSLPERKLPASTRRQSERAPRTARDVAGSAVRTRVGSRSRTVARSGRRPATRRRTVHIGFAIFASVVLTLMVAGIVALTALLDQRTFQITALQQQVSSFQSRDRVLTEQAAALDAPGRIGIWARRHGLAAPPQGAVVILDVPGQGPASGGRP